MTWSLHITASSPTLTLCLARQWAILLILQLNRTCTWKNQTFSILQGPYKHPNIVSTARLPTVHHSAVQNSAATPSTLIKSCVCVHSQEQVWQWQPCHQKSELIYLRASWLLLHGPKLGLVGVYREISSLAGLIFSFSIYEIPTCKAATNTSTTAPRLSSRWQFHSSSNMSQAEIEASGTPWTSGGYKLARNSGYSPQAVFLSSASNTSQATPLRCLWCASRVLLSQS